MPPARVATTLAPACHPTMRRDARGPPRCARRLRARSSKSSGPGPVLPSNGTMTGPEFALFDTEIGRCGVAWSADGIAGLQLPESKELRTRARIEERFPGARESLPPPAIRRALDAITGLLRGQPIDLSDVPLDLNAVPPFHRRVYAMARSIPPGATVSYGELA